MEEFFKANKAEDEKAINSVRDRSFNDVTGDTEDRESEFRIEKDDGAVSSMRNTTVSRET